MPQSFITRSNQERYLLAERFTEASYPIPHSVRLRGALDVARLTRALRDTCAAHDILRTSFQAEGTGFAGIVADQPPEVSIDLVDARKDDESAVRRHFIAYFYRKIDRLVPEELIRAQLIQLQDDEQILSLSLHHILADAVSILAYVEEVFARYNGQDVHSCGQFTALQPDENDDAGQYWRDLLSNVEDIAEIPFDLDADIPVEDHITQSIPVPRAIIDDLATRLKVRPFSILSALSNLVFAKHSGSHDVLLTFQSAGRRALDGAEKVIGPFSNSVVLRTRIAPEQRFEALAQQVRQSTTQALRHEGYPYHRIVRDTGLQPRFGINMYPPIPQPSLDGVEMLGRGIFYRQTNYDLDLRLEQHDDHYLIWAIYDNQRFGAERIKLMLEDFARMAKEAAAEPESTVRSLWGDTEPLVAPDAPAITDARLFDAFLTQAAQTPERIALVGHDHQMTYAEVEAASANLARRLVADGLGPGSRVAILAERGTTLVWSMLAVLRIGATMVPLDGNYPQDRLATLVRVARPDALVRLTKGDVPDWAGGIMRHHVADDPKAQVPDDIPQTALAAGDAAAPAYILFTSGSTGTPKGVATAHAPVLNFLRWQRETFGIGPEDRFTNLNGLAHDMMVRDIFAPLSVGAQLAIPQQEEIFRPDRLLGWLQELDPTVMHLTPAMGNLLSMAADQDSRLPLRLAFSGGDRLLPETVAALNRLAPDVEVVNFYGATETPQAAGFHRCDPKMPWRSYPVGKGIDHFALRIVGPDHQPVPQGTPGEIAILSPFISLGYVQDGEIVPHETPDIYFTGDTGVELPGGEVMFTGRQDDQISIRGYRIELDEIEEAMKEHGAVDDARVLFEETPTPRLIGYIAGAEVDANAVRAWLNRKLPAYMVPADIVSLEAIPLLPNGKTDRQALRAIPITKTSATPYRAPETAMERDLVAIWEGILDVEGIGADQSFAELHGDSLNFVQVLLATEAKVGQLPDHWELMPLSEVAELNAPTAKYYKWIDSAILTRAMAIMAVVAMHLQTLDYGGGATGALLLVTGFFVGRLQLVEAFRTHSPFPFLRTFGRILLPCALFIGMFTAAKLATGAPIHWSVPAFMVDFVDYDRNRDLGVQGQFVFFWYIDALLKIMLFFYLTSLVTFRWKLTDSPVQFVMTLFCVGLVLRFLLPGFIDPDYWDNGIRRASAVSFMPTTHLATVCLGMLIAVCNSYRERVIMMYVVFAYAAATFMISSSGSHLFFVVFGLMMLFVPRVPIPKGLHRVILTLSASSLFIYLTHMLVGNGLVRAGLERGSVLQWVVTLLIGVLCWYGWQALTPWRTRLADRTMRVMGQTTAAA